MPESTASPSPTLWDRTKHYSNSAYTKALKPGFDKAYTVMNKLEPHANKFSHKIGSESFWPGSLDKESEKAARILRSFCKDGFYDQIDEAKVKKAEAEGIELTDNTPKGKVRVIKKIPAKVIQNAKGLAIFTCMRSGWVIGGSGGAGVLIGRHPETGEWSPPSGIHMQNLSIGFLIGVDFTDTVLVINSYEALNAFTKTRVTLGTEIAVAAGPLGMGGTVDSEVNKKPAPVWSYVKSRGVYGGVAIDGNMVIERTDENEVFYNERVGVAKILLGEVRYPPVEKYKVLLDTVKAAQGDQVDDSLLPEGAPPGDMEMAAPGPTFGVPDEDDPDPYGYKALEAQGLTIREAGTHRRASPESFEFKPSPTSPVYHAYRKSMDAAARRKEWRSSAASISSQASMDRGTQTDEDEVKSPRITDNPLKEVEVHHNSPLRGSISADSDKAGHEATDHHTSTRHSGLANGMGLGINTGEEIDEKRKTATADEDVTLETPTATVHSNTNQLVSNRHDDDVNNSTFPAPQIESSKSDEKKSNGIHKDKQHESDDDADSEDDGDYSDFEEVEIVTAVPVTAKPKAGMVNIPQRVAPALPPRNPIRMSHSPMGETPAHGGLERTWSSTETSEQIETTDAAEGTTARRGSNSHGETHLKLDAQEEFHSAAPSPMEEKKLTDVVAAS